MGGGAISFFNTKTEKLNIAVLLCMLYCCVAVFAVVLWLLWCCVFNFSH